MKPVNLNRYRKAKAREESRAQADANAVKFGRTKAERTREASDAAKAARDLDGKKRDP